MRKIKTIPSLIILLGLSIFGIGLGSVSSYLSGNIEVTAWVGDTPMSFSTAVTCLLSGLAFYMIGKYAFNDKISRQI